MLTVRRGKAESSFTTALGASGAFVQRGGFKATLHLLKSKDADTQLDAPRSKSAGASGSKYSFSKAFTLKGLKEVDHAGMH